MSSHLDRVSNDLLRQWQDSDDAESSLLDVQKTRAQSLLNSTVLPPTLPSKTPPSNMTLQYSLRPPTSPELGHLYTWLKQDEETYPGLKSKNPARYWSRAGETGALQNCFETECGVLCKRKGYHVCRLLLCCFIDGGDDGATTTTEVRPQLPQRGAKRRSRQQYYATRSNATRRLRSSRSPLCSLLNSNSSSLRASTPRYARLRFLHQNFQ